MNRRLVVFLVVALIFCIQGCMYSLKNDIEICDEQSMFQYFYVEDHTVHIICKITIENKSTSNAEVLLNAISDEDANNNLLINSKLNGFNTETGSTILFIKAGKIQEFIIDFQGEFGGNNQKCDRMLPDVLELVLVK